MTTRERGKMMQASSRPRSMAARLQIGLSPVLLGILLFGVVSCGAEAQQKKKAPKRQYSASGYDLTSLSKKEKARILKTLTPLQIDVTQNEGTERAGTGELLKIKEPGIYVSAVGGLPLFRSSHKFESGTGWPSFFEVFDPDHVILKKDTKHGWNRTEVLCARSGAHLGHVFKDGPKPTGLRYCMNSAALKFIPEGKPVPVESRPAKTETAYFAGGCFWGVEDRFAQMDGVVDAVSGYQNGTTKEPTYRQICTGRTGHAESVMLRFDPRRTSFETLVRAFFKIHDPTTPNRQGPDRGTQYRSGIFTVNEQQAKVAHAVVADLKKRSVYGSRKIVTIIEKAGTFWPAEEYHQDYHLKHGGSCALPKGVDGK